VVCLGVFDGAQLVDAPRLVQRETRLFFAVSYSGRDGLTDFDLAIDMMAADPALVSPLLTHRFPLSEVEEAFRVAADKRSGAVRVGVEPNEA
jgi:threonine dehydrogenase-like Zn-dependent dehydrogenase